MSEWKCSYGRVCECKSDVEKYECDLAYKTEMKQTKQEKLDILNKIAKPCSDSMMKKWEWRVRNRWWLKHWQRMHIKYLRFKRWYNKPKQR